jgi:multicomponent Na+:H+ antiporter subunit E
LQAEISKAEYWRSAAARGASFIALWFALAGVEISDLPAMIAAIVAATVASLELLPPGRVHPSFAGLVMLGADFLRQSAVAGADVAWRALSPSMPLKPGYVTSEVKLQPGLARSAFCTLMSLLPGSLPAWQDNEGKIIIHCLDDSQPVAAQMANEEKLFVKALGV